MASGRDNSLAKQIGECLVCAELGRRGIIATGFAGNIPTFDILAADEYCRALPIQVKAYTSNNWPSTATRWMKLDFDQISKKQNYTGPTELENPDLIYVYVAIELGNGMDRYFILTKSDVQQVYVNHYDLDGEKRLAASK